MRELTAASTRFIKTTPDSVLGHFCQGTGNTYEENVLVLYSVLATLFPRVHSLEFGHIVNLGLLESSWASFMMLVLVLVGSVSLAFSSRLLHPVDEK